MIKMTRHTLRKTFVSIVLVMIFCRIDVAEAGEAEARLPSSFYVANWNLENLFDTDDDPDNPFDNEFLPHSNKTKWNNEKLAKKLSNQARVIQDMNNGNGPDIMGFEEVEHEALIKSLLMNLNGHSYGIAYAESSDRRGIDTGLIYNRDMFSIVDVQKHTVDLGEIPPTRDILQVLLQGTRGETFHIFVNHWPSRSGGVLKSSPRRYKAAEVLAQAIDEILKKGSNTHIIVLGDFNDTPSDRSLREVLQAQPYPSGSHCEMTTLYNISAGTSGNPDGTFLHNWNGNREWRHYDQIIASGSLVDGEIIECDGPLDIIAPEYMRYPNGSSKGAPFPTYGKRSRYLGGYSDHFPVGVTFNYK